jgi:LysR family glycine cleavage system transcriptional activator
MFDAMRRLPPLAALRAFEAAARHLSFRRAAQELRVTPTAISHQIRLLEGTLGLKLFERRPRQVLMTPQAQLLFPVLRDGFDAFARALDTLTRPRRRATVTVSATRLFTARCLVPRIGEFQSWHPDIDLRLHASDAPADIAGGDADIAVRYGRGPYPGLESEHLFADSFAPVASPRLGLREPADIRAAMLIHAEWHRSDPSNPTWARWLALAGMRDVDATAGLRFTDDGHAIQATIAGRGVALASLALLADELAAGTLVVPFGPEIEGLSYHLLHAGGPVHGAAAVVRDWLRDTLGGLR